jgi:hypothetical protein
VLKVVAGLRGPSPLWDRLAKQEAASLLVSWAPEGSLGLAPE